MKMSFHAVVLVLLVCITIGKTAEPNSEKTFIIGVGKDSLGRATNIVNITYTDGLGRELITKNNNSAVNDTDLTGTDFLTKCNFYDDAGRLSKVTKPYISHNDNFKTCDLTEISNVLENQYSSFNDDARYAYSETKYFDDPFSIARQIAGPGLKNCITSSPNGTVQNWFFGTGDEEVTALGMDFKLGFISGGLDSNCEGKLDSLYEYMLDNNTRIFTGGVKYYLSVTKDAAGQYSQTKKDITGRVISTAVQKTAGTSEFVISSSQYDILGNKMRDIAPTQDVEPLPEDMLTKIIDDTKYQYNTYGQVIKKVTPDGLIERYSYTSDGLLYETQYYCIKNGIEVQYNQRPSLKRTYDNFGRIKEIIQVYYSAEPEIRYFYDDTVEIALDHSIPKYVKELLCNLRNLKGKLACAINYNFKNYVIDLYSYDNDGNVEIKYKIIPGVPVQKTEYTYDIHGKVLSDKISAGKVVYEKKYKYDFLGRLIEITPSDDSTKKLVTYDYNDFGQNHEKHFFGDISTSYQFTINDQTKVNQTNLNSLSKFTETMSYLSNSNIDTAVSIYNGYSATPDTFKQVYTYDNLNRLRSVNTDGKSLFNCSYDYDNVGRFISKTEGTSNLPDYTYYTNTNRLMNTNASSTDIEYVYDKFGNLVVDKKKKMIIDYDWRNMPVEFNFYDTIPDEIKVNSRGDYYILVDSTEYSGSLYSFINEKIASGNVLNLLSSVTMLYDAGGSRVLKIESVQ